MAPSGALPGTLSHVFLSKGDQAFAIPHSHIFTIQVERSPFTSLESSDGLRHRKGHICQACSQRGCAKIGKSSGSSFLHHFHLASRPQRTVRSLCRRQVDCSTVGQPYSSLDNLVSSREQLEVNARVVSCGVVPSSIEHLRVGAHCAVSFKRTRLLRRQQGLLGQRAFSRADRSLPSGQGRLHALDGEGRESEGQSLDEEEYDELDDNEDEFEDAEEDDEESFFSGGAEIPEPWSGTYEKAKNLLSSLARGVSKLETGFNTRQQELGESTEKIERILSSEVSNQGQSLREAEENVRRLELQVQSLHRDRATGEQRMAELGKQYEQVYLRFKEAEELAAEAQFLREEVDVRQEEKMAMEQQLELARQREEEVIERIKSMEEGLAQRDSLLQQLQHESSLSSSALQQAAKAMVAARDRTLRMEEQLEHTGDLLAKERQVNARAREKAIQLTTDLAEAKQLEEEMRVRLEQLAEEVVSKEVLIEKTREESLKTREMLDLTTRSLAEARDTIEALQQLVDAGQEKLRQEIEASSEALRSAAQKEHALRHSDLKVRELSAELEALKDEMMDQERAMATMREETVKNAKLLMQAAQTRQELEQAQTRIAQLEGQVVTLETEVRSRDSLLEDLKSEIDISTEALEVAAKYKKELNRTKEREAELEEELEAREALVVEMRRELSDNMRAQRAEHALRQVEMQVRTLEDETETLRRGVLTRDEAIALMKSELDQSAEMLKAAANNREALRELQRQVEILKAELEARDERLANQEQEPYGYGMQSGNSFSNQGFNSYEANQSTYGSSYDMNQSAHGSSYDPNQQDNHRSSYDMNSNADGNRFDMNQNGHDMNPTVTPSPAFTHQRRGGGVWNRGARRGGYGPSRTPR